MRSPRNSPGTIHFYTGDTSYRWRKIKALREWVRQCAQSYQQNLGSISFIISSQQELLLLNQQYLQHDTHTDVITFDYSQSGEISGEIYLGIDRIRENARQYKVRVPNELHRVMIHGMLHLFGYRDGSEEQRQAMRAQENHCLSLRKF